MITPEKLTREKLSSELVKKHKQLIENYKKEFGLSEKIRVLDDKQEQIEHWLSDAKDTKDEDKYIKALGEVDKGLDALKKELGVINKDTGTEKRYAWLKNQIKEEEKVIEHWKEKSKEFEKQDK